MHFIRSGALLGLAIMGIGCGRGLTVDLNATPDPANPGQSVKWNLSVRNDSPCAITEEMVDLPDPLPDSAGGFGLIFGFIPELDGFGAAEFCRMFSAGLNACSDPACVSAHLEEALGPEIASALDARAQAAHDSPVSLPAAGACETLDVGPGGLIGFCAFGALAPGETATAMLTADAPDTGNTRAAQLALAFAPALGRDCRPGSEVGDGEWILSGCFPLVAETAPAPALSPTATFAGAAVLLMIGGLGLYRRRRS